ncbi:putative tRNA:m(4)X modification enzyme [Dioscorea sansibarensis]
MEKRCEFWLPNKRRHCANGPLPNSSYCGNHDPSSIDLRVPCPIDPSHSVTRDSLKSHLRRCPFAKRTRDLESQPYFSKGINTSSVDSEDEIVSSDSKRKTIHGLTPLDFHHLITKIKSLHSTICSEMRDSLVIPERCSKWMNSMQERQVPFQEKHAVQQASIIGNMEEFGIISKPLGDCDGLQGEKGEGEGEGAAIVEFGAGRGYLAHMLADCYGFNKVFLIERRSYKLKADRSLRQNESLVFERLRIDIKDLNLHAIESLKELPYLAVGKHLCGSATDLTIRCCLPDRRNPNKGLPFTGRYIQGLALATCCHHLCQWKHYINKDLLSKLGITEPVFHAITWFSSWAVDADHSSELSDKNDQEIHRTIRETEESGKEIRGVDEIIRKMPQLERAVLGFMCKEIIDMGRLLWLRVRGLDAQLRKYVPSNVSPENHLLVAKQAA